MSLWIIKLIIYVVMALCCNKQYRVGQTDNTGAGKAKKNIDSCVRLHIYSVMGQAQSLMILD